LRSYWPPAEKSRTFAKHAAIICSGPWKRHAMERPRIRQTVLAPSVEDPPTIHPYRETTNRRLHLGGTPGKSSCKTFREGTPWLAANDVAPCSKRCSNAGPALAYLHLAVSPRASHDQRDLCPRRGLFAEQPFAYPPVGSGIFLLPVCETSRAVLISSRGDSPLPATSPTERTLSFVFDQVKVLLRYHTSGGSYGSPRLPLANDQEVGSRQKSTRDSGASTMSRSSAACSSIRKMVQAKRQQGIFQSKRCRFDGVVLEFAQMPNVPAAEASERFIHAVE